MTSPAPDTSARLILPDDQRWIEESRARGYLANVLVEISGDRRYAVNFYDPVRLTQELDDAVHAGTPYFAEPATIVIPDVTPAAMDIAVQGLHKGGYFDHLAMHHTPHIRAATDTSLRVICSNDKQVMDEAPDRGYLSHVLVEIDGVRLYPVFFFTPDRLGFELDMGVRHGTPFIAEVGMIFIPAIEVHAMEKAVQSLQSDGYFDHLAPLTHEQVARADPWAWPPKPA